MTEQLVDVKILNLGGYVSGVRTKFPLKEAQGYEKAGYVKILSDGKETNKMSPSPAKKGGKK